MAGDHNERAGRGSLHALYVVAIFLGALAAYVREGGVSPIAWVDTFNDEMSVQQCLNEDTCTLVGIGTSIPGFVHAAGWLEFRTLLASLGLGLDGAYRIMQVCNALAVALVFDLTALISGPVAGAAAILIWFYGIGASAVQTNALYNSTPLLFLGAVFVLTCTAVVERATIWLVAVAAGVGAILANVHLACVLTGVSVLCAALYAPRRRLSLALFGITLFAVITVVIAPPCWRDNMKHVLWPNEPRGATDSAVLQGGSFVFWALFALAAWIRSFWSHAPEWVAYRRRSRGAFVVLIPFLVPFVVAPLFGISAGGKYIAHVKAACCIAAALPLAVVAAAVRRRLRPHQATTGVTSPRWVTTLPFAVALMVAILGPVADLRIPTISDLIAVAAQLHDARGWDVEHMAQRVKTPEGGAVLPGLVQIGGQLRNASTAVADASAIALLLTLDRVDVPQPLPANWTIVRETWRQSLLLIQTHSHINWTDFEICLRSRDGSEQSCRASGIRLDPRSPVLTIPDLPPGGPRFSGTLTLRLPLHPVSAETGEEIFMPHMPGRCAGHIVADENIVHTDADRRHGILVSDPNRSGQSTIAFEWQLGSPDCDRYSYNGSLPFFVSGDPATVHLVETILRKEEG